MSKDQLRITGEQGRQAGWEGVVLFFLSAGLSVLAWLSAKTVPHGWSIAALAALHVVLTVTLQRWLAYLPLNLGWSYRLAFLASVGLGTIWGAVSIFAPAFGPSAWLWLPAVLGGSFAGGLAAAGLDGPLWENNSPPSERIREEVALRHRERIGAPDPSPLSKRLFDFSLALLGLFISAPLWMLSTFLLWFEDPGPVLFVKNSVGRGGVNFYQFKFRTMVRQAEDNTGPIHASEKDGRVLWIGRFLRKTALDELPQLINILKGEMSFVGPRPQRTVLVHGYLEKLPEYAERHRVLPGLSGLAQVAGDYYLTPRQKLRFDRLYIRHASLGFDFKLILLAFLITFWYRWQKGWNGRLPRGLVRMRS
jgi:lipopolysaccharide/colanic/teichoic acid biosynthesis glycosyltransferase